MVVNILWARVFKVRCFEFYWRDVKTKILPLSLWRLRLRYENGFTPSANILIPLGRKK